MKILIVYCIVCFLELFVSLFKIKSFFTLTYEYKNLGKKVHLWAKKFKHVSFKTLYKPGKQHRREHKGNLFHQNHQYTVVFHHKQVLNSHNCRNRYTRNNPVRNRIQPLVSL